MNKKEVQRTKEIRICVTEKEKEIITNYAKKFDKLSTRFLRSILLEFANSYNDNNKVSS